MCLGLGWSLLLSLEKPVATLWSGAEWSAEETQILEPDCQDSRPLLAVCP